MMQCALASLHLRRQLREDTILPALRECATAITSTSSHNVGEKGTFFYTKTGFYI